jgi:hypothetical protein
MKATNEIPMRSVFKGKERMCRLENENKEGVIVIAQIVRKSKTSSVKLLI